METEAISIFHEFADLIARYAVDIAGAFAIAIGGWIASALLQRLVRRALERSDRLEPAIRVFLTRAVRYIVLIFVAVIVLAQFGVQTASIIAVIGTAGIGIALALQGTLSNVAAGLVLLFLRPFGIGDSIDAEGITGTVDEIGLLTTRMRTFDGVFLEVPNGQIWNRAIKNFSRLPSRRVDVPVGISYDDDIDRAKAVLLALLTADSRIHADPEPQVMVMELGDNSVNLNMRAWTDSDEYGNVRSELNQACKQAIEAEGMTIPFPQRDIHVQPPESSVPPGAGSPELHQDSPFSSETARLPPREA